MLAKLLVDVLRPRKPKAQVQAPTLERIRKLSAAAEAAPIDRHLQILYGGVRVAGIPLLELADEAMRRSSTRNPPAKMINRWERTFHLAQYFLHASTLPGLKVECGVFGGASALACCLAGRAADRTFDGTGFHLVDSFEGLSDPTRKDWFDGGAPPLWPPKGFKNDIDAVRPVFTEFPGVRLHKGWIPEVLKQLPEAQWSFVHIDVDLYQPTRACLEYFLPRLVPGAVVICDDYGSLMFPGAARAWDDVLLGAGHAFVELPSGQAIFLRASVEAAA